MTAIEYRRSLSLHLFWDIRKEDFVPDEHISFMVKRVLEYGLLSDWLQTKKYYGLTKIVEVAKDFREFEPRALAYLSLISNTPKEQFRCYTCQQSIPLHWNF